MAKLEKDTMLAIRKHLSVWEQTKVVLYHERMHSGMIRHEGRYIRMCKQGTPDFIAVYRNRQGLLGLLFIEAKSDTGKLRPDQILFRDRYKGMQDIFFMVCTDVSQVNTFFSINGYDYVKDISL